MGERVSIAKTGKLFIGGGFVRSESGRTTPVEERDGAVVAHVARASRKDLRDAVEAARKAAPGWAGRTAYNRGQILYRMAEMIEARRDEFIGAMEHARGAGGRSSSSSSRRSAITARSEVEAAIDRMVCFAGWADKYAHVLGCANPVAGPYHNFTIPEPTGLVVVVAPETPSLLGLVSLLAPPLCAGNVVVAIASDRRPLPAVAMGEVCATADVPTGVVNILTARRGDLLEPIASHREINAVSAANLTKKERTTLQLGVAENLKRVHIVRRSDGDWLDPAVCDAPGAIEPFVEFKTLWHPSAV